MSTPEREPTFRRAVVLMTATSFLVPLGGLITAPILARALGADGRGEMAAALAPAALLLGAATLGLPDALTYYLAKRPSSTRVAVLWGALVTVVLGIFCLGLTIVALPFLSGDQPRLGEYIVLATAWTIPALIVGVMRGAAMGRQLWSVVATERVVMTALRVVSFFVLWQLGLLTVYTAVLVSVLLPILAGIVYLVLFASPPKDRDQDGISPRVFVTTVSYGSRVWLGSVASMTLSRIAPILMLPLSSARDLGLYTVASTISDLPLIVALAIQGTLFGMNSRSGSTEQVTTTARLTTLTGLLGCIVLGASLPLWIGPLFGNEFTDAIVPTLMLLASAVICIPGLMAASGLSAWGRPALRSAALVITLVANAAALIILVPILGVYGAAWTSIISNVVLTSSMVLIASKVMGVKVGDFLLFRKSDFVLGWTLVTDILARVTRRRPRS